MTYTSYDLLKYFIENHAKIHSMAISLEDDEMLASLEQLLREDYINGVVIDDDYVDLSEATVTPKGLKYFESHKKL